jgi:hypothetical protein
MEKRRKAEEKRARRRRRKERGDEGAEPNGVDAPVDEMLVAPESGEEIRVTSSQPATRSAP